MRKLIIFLLLIPVCFSYSIEEYLEDNPRIKTVVDSFNQEQQIVFYDIEYMLEVGDDIFPIKPQSSTFTQEEWDYNHALRLALTVYIDKNNLTSWKLKDYTDSQLKYLIGEDWLFGDIYSSFLEDPYYHKQWTVHEFNPMETHEYSKKHIKNNITNSIFSIFDDVRGKQDRAQFIHEMQGGNTPSNLDINYLLIWENYLNKYRLGRGCHGMVKVLVAMLRSINIPAYYDQGWLYGHASLFIPEYGLLDHGDIIYSSYTMDAPSNELMTSWEFYLHRNCSRFSDKCYELSRIHFFELKEKYWDSKQPTDDIEEKPVIYTVGDTVNVPLILNNRELEETDTVKIERFCVWKVNDIVYDPVHIKINERCPRINEITLQEDTTVEAVIEYYEFVYNSEIDDYERGSRLDINDSYVMFYDVRRDRPSQTQIDKTINWLKSILDHIFSKIQQWVK